MEKVLFKSVNQKLIGGGQSNLNKLNNIIKNVRSYEITDRNISVFSWLFIYNYIKTDGK